MGPVREEVLELIFAGAVVVVFASAVAAIFGRVSRSTLAALGVIVAAAALVLVLESFGRDVLWLARVNHTAPALVSLEKAPTTSPREESR